MKSNTSWKAAMRTLEARNGSVRSSRPAANLLPLHWLGRRVGRVESAHLHTAEVKPLQSELCLLGLGCGSWWLSPIWRHWCHRDMASGMEGTLLVETHGWKAWRRLNAQVLGTGGEGCS